MTVLDRKLITRMVNPQPGGNGGGGGAGGAGVYELPAASSSELGGIKLGYPTGTGKFYPVQLDSQQRAYVDVPWTDHYAWSDITDKPTTATRWPSWDEVTSKPSSFTPSAHTHAWGDITSDVPATATRWPSWTEVTSKPTSKTAWGKTYLNASSEFQNIDGDMNSVGNISFSASGKSIGGFVYFNTTNGYLGIGDANPAYRLEVSGNCRISSKLLVATTDATYELNVGGTIYATGSITERSDIRCKDVETYQWCPTLDMIADAPIIRYTMKDDETHRMRVGTVAQYWDKVMPEAVSKDNDGILSIAQGDICMVNVIALAREVRKLREEVIQLKKWG